MLAAEAGCPATTTALAAVAMLHRLAARRIALVLPGAAAEGTAHAAGFAAEDIDTIAMHGLGCRDNRSAAALPEAAILGAARALAADAAPDAILIWSTNLPGLPCMAPLEAEFGIPVLDSAALGVAALLAAVGIDATPLAPLGRVFATP
jgi:maleate isomerase